jgi:AcrR family transcriptional regulator
MHWSTIQGVATGLRERKKRTTHDTIQDAALELFARDGFQATTIAAIAEAADVAPRTVSIHFPAKEDLLFPHDSAIDELELRLEHRAPGQSALDALRAWIADGLRAREAAGEAQRRRDWERARSRRAIIDADESLRQRERGQLEHAERLIAAAVARDTGGAPSDLVPQMAASATVALLTMLERRQSGQEPGPLSAEQGLALVDRVVSFLNGGMAAVTETDS